MSKLTPSTLPDPALVSPKSKLAKDSALQHRPLFFSILCCFLCLALAFFSLFWQRRNGYDKNKHYQYSGPVFPLQQLGGQQLSLRSNRLLLFSLDERLNKADILDHYEMEAAGQGSLHLLYPRTWRLADGKPYPMQIKMDQQPLSSVPLLGQALSNSESRNWQEDRRALLQDQTLFQMLATELQQSQTAEQLDFETGAISSLSAALLPRQADSLVHSYQFSYSPSGAPRALYLEIDPEQTAVVAFGADQIRYDQTTYQVRFYTEGYRPGAVRVYCLGKQPLSYRLNETDANDQTYTQSAQVTETHQPLETWQLPALELIQERIEQENFAKSQVSSPKSQPSPQEATSSSESPVRIQATVSRTTESHSNDRVIAKLSSRPSWAPVLAQLGKKTLLDESWLTLLSRRFLHELALSWIQQMQLDQLDAKELQKRWLSQKQQSPSTPNQAAAGSASLSKPSDEQMQTAPLLAFGASLAESKAWSEQFESPKQKPFAGDTLLNDLLLRPHLLYQVFSLHWPHDAEAHTSSQSSSMSRKHQLDLLYTAPLSQHVLAEQSRKNPGFWRHEKQQAARAGQGLSLERLSFLSGGASSLPLQQFWVELKLGDGLNVGENNLKLQEASSSQRFLMPGGPEFGQIDLKRLAPIHQAP